MHNCTSQKVERVEEHLICPGACFFMLVLT
jgi:hypothetical protein